jgi:hypothetical protein
MRRKWVILIISIPLLLLAAGYLFLVSISSSGNVPVNGTLSPSDVAAIKSMVRRRRWRESWEQIAHRGIREIPSAIGRLTNHISGITVLQGGRTFIPNDATSNRNILGEAEVAIPFWVGNRSGHLLYMMKKDSTGWSCVSNYVWNPPFELPQDPSSAIPYLIKFCHNPVPWYRVVALFQLTNLSDLPETRSAIPEIVLLLKDPDERVRREATNTLIQIDPAKARELIGK